MESTNAATLRMIVSVSADGASLDDLEPAVLTFHDAAARRRAWQQPLRSASPHEAPTSNVVAWPSRRPPRLGLYPMERNQDLRRVRSWREAAILQTETFRIPSYLVLT